VTATRAVVAFGANLGDREAALRRAVGLLAARTQLVAVSAVFETEPVGGPAGQPAFYNAIAIVDTDLDAVALLALAHELEADAGRVRLEHWGPRTLDVDLICVGDLITTDPELTLPHPRAHERAFVLLPWLDADPAASLPGSGSVRELLAGLPQDGVRKLPGSNLLAGARS
jgi:2-amino-4-hydroxy-6-hydroxymethyldihydropteridine diphosphokinase